MCDWPQTLAADRSVNALWPLAAGCLTYMYSYIYISHTVVIHSEKRACPGLCLICLSAQLGGKVRTLIKVTRVTWHRQDAVGLTGRSASSVR